MKRLSLILASFSLAILLCSTQSVLADTEVGIDISEDTVWTAANSPYVVTSNVNVSVDVSLTIEAGVTVKFNPDTRLNVYGTLTAEGLSESLVTFTSNKETKTPGDWYGIILYSEANDSDLSWCVIEYTNTGLTFSECSAVISDSILRYCSEDGISVFAETDACDGAQAEPTITRCTLENNTQHGISYKGFGGSGWICIPSSTGWVGGTISENTINNNGGAGINIIAYDSEYMNGAAGPEILSNDIFNNESGIIMDGDGNVSPTISENLIYGNGNSGILNKASDGEIIIRDNTIYENEGAAIHNYLSPALESNIINEKNPYQPGSLIGYIELSDIYMTNGLAYDGAYFYTRPNDQIYKYDKSGNLISSFDSPQNCISRPRPYAMAFDGTYFWAVGVIAIYKIDTDWNLIDTFECPVSISNVSGMTYDGNNLWIAEQNHFDGHKIHKLDSSGNIIESIEISISPTGIAFDGTYFLMAAGRRIYRIDSNGNTIGNISSPVSISGGFVFDGSNLWVNKYNNQVPCIDKIYKIDTSGNILASFDAPGTSTSGFAFDGSSLWIADSNKAKIYQADTNGSIVSEREFPSPCTYHREPTRLTFNDNILWTATDSQHGAIINKLDTEGNIIESFSLSTSDVYGFGTNIYGFGFDGNNLWLGNTDVFSPESATIEIFDTSGRSVLTLTSPVNPYGLTFDNEYVWITDYENIYKLDKELNIISSFENITDSVGGIAISDSFLSIRSGGEIHQIITEAIAPITGTILTNEGDPIENICVEAISIENANRYLGNPTDSNGEFTIIAPPLRDYYIKTDVSCTAPNIYGDKWWDGEGGIHDESDAMVVSYTINPIVTPIQFKLIQDADNDGVGDSEDLCPGYDDSVDVDADGIPDGCDSVQTSKQGFDYLSYLSANPDLTSSWGKAECMNHYKLYGFAENRAVTFNLEEYLNANPDFPTNWTLAEGLNHYNMYGKFENRILAFDAQEYLSLYADLPQNWTYEEAFAHYANYGSQEGRIASFDETAYLELYSDLPGSWGQEESFYHYIYYGRNESRVYDPYDENVFLTN